MSTYRCTVDRDGVNECREAVRSTLSHQAGVLVTVSTAIPAGSGFTSPRGYICPHGTTYWVSFPAGGDFP